MSISHEFMSHALDSDAERFRTSLSEYAIVDIGILESTSKRPQGLFGVLRSNKPSSDGSIHRYTNVELLNIGSSKGGFKAGGDGEDLYLLFCPANVMASSVDRKAHPNPRNTYASLGMKGLPVASSLTWLSSMGFDRIGNLHLTFPDSSLSFNLDSSIAYQHQGILKAGKNADGSAYVDILAGTHQMFLAADGTWYKCSWSGGYIHDMQIVGTNGTFTHRKWSTSQPTAADKEDLLNYADFLYEKVCSPDGSVSELYKNSSGTTICSEVITTAGKRTLTSVGAEVNAGSGKVKLATTTFNLYTWLDAVIGILQTIAVDPGSHVMLATITTQLGTKRTELTAGME